MVSVGSKTVKSDWEKRDPHPRYDFGSNFNVAMGEMEGKEVHVQVIEKGGME